MIHVDGTPTICSRTVDPERKRDSKRRYYQQQRDEVRDRLRARRTLRPTSR